MYVEQEEYLTSWKKSSHVESGMSSILGALLQIFAPLALSLSMFWKHSESWIIDNLADIYIIQVLFTVGANRLLYSKGTVVEVVSTYGF